MILVIQFPLSCYLILLFSFSLFEEAIEAVGMEFRSDKLWDAYIDFETSHGSLKSVLKIFDNLLSTPTQQYVKHFARYI